MKTALITGASGEIGAAIAREFAAAGYAVAVHGAKNFEKAEKLAEDLRAAGCTAFPVCGDLSDPAQAERVWAESHGALGHIDVLVNGAGISLVDFFDAMTPEDWNRIVAVNLSSAVYLSQCASREMIRRKAGAIVNISSIWGVSGAAMEVAYSAVKAGMIGMTRALALELAPSGITVNAVAPGYIDTKMNAHLSEDDKAALCEDIPLGRAGKPEEVASAVRFMAESPYITGETLVVSGGWR
ncbi:MAG: 3-oxoacyl-ACP reductase FabG [Clostridia bacterium]|nr:3-oxoacyl-ACP reductase FabG [Clostridia bacterium]